MATNHGVTITADEIQCLQADALALALLVRARAQGEHWTASVDMELCAVEWETDIRLVQAAAFRLSVSGLVPVARFA